jgi:uncharacterized BrkB/YihY/UPF0761 family membrane protein
VPNDLESGDEERHREELAKLNFELCKHLTTLSVAGAVVVLAVYREVAFERVLLAITLSVFGITIIVSVLSMILSMAYFTVRGSRDREAADPALMWASVLASVFFLVGIEAFMLLLLDLPVWALAFAAVGVLLPWWFVRAYFRRRRAPTR